MDNELKIFDDDDDFDTDTPELADAGFESKPCNLDARRLIEKRMEEKRLEQLLREYD